MHRRILDLASKWVAFCMSCCLLTGYVGIHDFMAQFESDTQYVVQISWGAMDPSNFLPVRSSFVCRSVAEADELDEDSETDLLRWQARETETLNLNLSYLIGCVPRTHVLSLFLRTWVGSVQHRLATRMRRRYLSLTHLDLYILLTSSIKSQNLYQKSKKYLCKLTRCAST